MWLYNFVTVYVQGQSVMVDRLGCTAEEHLLDTRLIEGQWTDK